MPTLSQRAELVPPSPIRKLAPLAAAAHARGIKVYSLNIGQPDLPSPGEAFKALTRVDRDVLEYSQSDGLPSLRRKMAEYYHKAGIEVSEDEIIVTTGGSEAVLLAFLATLNPGDEVIIPEPAYANYISFSITAGAHVVPVTAKIENGFALPPIEEFERLITPRTRAILMCNPNNPTGYVYSAEELEKLREIVKRHDLYLFSDEVYREFCYTGTPCMSALNLKGIDENVVVIDSVSKRYNECGIRIGALVTRNKTFHAAVMKFCQARLSPPLLGQIVAEESYSCSPEYMERTIKEYEVRRNCLVNGLNAIPGVHSAMPMGAFYTVAALPVDNAEDFCRWCLEKFDYEGETIFMAPAAGFYSTPEAGANQVRVAYVLKCDSLRRALKVLEEALKAYNAK